MNKVSEMVSKTMKKRELKKPPQGHGRVCHYTGAQSTQLLQEKQEEKDVKEQRRIDREKAKKDKEAEQRMKKWMADAKKAGGANIRYTPQRTTRSPLPKPKAKPKPKQ